MAVVFWAVLKIPLSRDQKIFKYNNIPVSCYIKHSVYKHNISNLMKVFQNIIQVI